MQIVVFAFNFLHLQISLWLMVTFYLDLWFVVLSNFLCLVFVFCFLVESWIPNKNHCMFTNIWFLLITYDLILPWVLDLYRLVRFVNNHIDLYQVCILDLYGLKKLNKNVIYIVYSWFFCFSCSSHIYKNVEQLTVYFIVLHCYFWTSWVQFS